MQTQIYKSLIFASVNTFATGITRRRSENELSFCLPTLTPCFVQWKRLNQEPIDSMIHECVRRVAARLPVFAAVFVERENEDVRRTGSRSQKCESRERINYAFSVTHFNLSSRMRLCDGNANVRTRQLKSTLAFPRKLMLFGGNEEEKNEIRVVVVGN